MAGLTPDVPNPTEIRLLTKSQCVEIVFDDGKAFSYPFEFLRVFTPSAEARGHGPGQETLQVGKKGVILERIEPVGNYAIKPVFSDGHDSGLYSWDLLYSLGLNQDALWADYLRRLEAEGASREPSAAPPAKGGCGSGGCSTH
jgi:DUF971 family protein